MLLTLNDFEKIWLFHIIYNVDESANSYLLIQIHNLLTLIENRIFIYICISLITIEQLCCLHTPHFLMLEVHVQKTFVLSEQCNKFT